MAGLAALIIVQVFVRRTQLAKRLPTSAPGLTTISAGIVLTLLTPMVLGAILVSGLPNPFRALVDHGLTMYPATMVLLAGCAQLLLAARGSAET